MVQGFFITQGPPPAYQLSLFLILCQCKCLLCPSLISLKSRPCAPTYFPVEENDTDPTKGVGTRDLSKLDMALNLFSVGWDVWVAQEKPEIRQPYLPEFEIRQCRPHLYVFAFVFLSSQIFLGWSPLQGITILDSLEHPQYSMSELEDPHFPTGTHLFLLQYL